MRRISFWILLWMTLGVAGCFNPFDPRVLRESGQSDPPPAPDSPENVLRLLEWCYKYRSFPEYRELFTDDYRFVFSQLDPYGNAYRTKPWTREDEIESTRKLFQGGDANQPAATSITLLLDRNFAAERDPRFPNSQRWRKLIRTSVTLVIVDANQAQTHASGSAVFSVVRGDSALIPEDLDLEPDSTRWFIERHEDLTNPPPDQGSARAVPVSAAFIRQLTWGGVKAWYR